MKPLSADVALARSWHDFEGWGVSCAKDFAECLVAARVCELLPRGASVLILV